MPLLTFRRTFDTTIDIGDVPVPIHVARLTKDQLEIVDEGWERLVVPPRGSALAPGTDAPDAERTTFARAEVDRFKEWNTRVAAERYTFFETMITNYITLDAGLIEDNGQPVVDGAGLLRLFHGRRDVLRDLISAVLTENHLVEMMRKNLNSPRGSALGSELSIPARGGDRPGSTAESAESSTTAGIAGATARNNGPDGAPASSGAPDDPTRVH